MRRYLGAAFVGCLLLAALAAPPVVLGTTSNVDCGSGADLQAAIAAAVPGDTLVIRGTCVGNFVIDRDLTLQGGRPKAVLDARGSGTVLTIPPAAGPATGATVRLSRLGIVGGNPAGIENWGHLTLQDSTVSRNTGVGISQNGDFGGTVALLSSVVVGTTGDGIRSLSGHLTLQDSKVSGNTGDGVLGFDLGVDVFHSTVSRNGGNGIVAGVQASFAIDHSTVSGNAGRGIMIPNGSVSVADSTVSNNTGGGIYNGVISYLTVRHSEVLGNTADFGAGIYIVAHDAGHGVTVEDSTIKGNTAGTSGGGVYTEGGPSGDSLTRVAVRNNTAGVSGGGIYKAAGSLALTDVVFHNNTPDDCFGC